MSPENRSWALVLAAVLGATGVAAGAFGAHGLKSVVPASQLDVWKTASHYHLLHALALMVLGLGMQLSGQLAASAWVRRAAHCWTAGTVVFSGSLYLLVLVPLPALGAITPVGGVLLVLGWVGLLLAALTLPSH
jgi:uncharacterized membrane protein YgdD (TMEM256/DUF423 family)